MAACKAPTQPGSTLSPNPGSFSIGRFAITPRTRVGLRVRIAVIADIHGNLPALDAVLRDVDQHGAERLIVNGDAVNRGPQSVEVLERLSQRNAQYTLGNHEDLLRAIADDDPTLPFELRHGEFWRAKRWCAQALAAGGWFDEVARWPLSLRIEEPGAPSLLIAHGSPRHNREGYGQHMDDALISEIVQMHPADVLVGSHTHWPLARRWGRYRVLNTGAVGVPFNGDGRAQYLLLTLTQDGWNAEFRRVAYSIDDALRAYHSSGYLQAGGLLARIFHDEVRDARSYLVPFQMWAEANLVPFGEAGFDAFRERHPERFAPVQRWPSESASVTP